MAIRTLTDFARLRWRNWARVFFVVAISWVAIARPAGEAPRPRWTSFAYPAAFEHISVKQGLSQSTVHCMLQDRRGFLWFGTDRGLNRFDGYKFKVFRHEKNNPASLSSDWIECLLEDHNGMLWIGSNNGGLCRLDPESLAIQTYEPSWGPGTLAINEITSLAEDHEGNVWVGVSGVGLSVLPHGRVSSATPKFHSIESPNGSDVANVTVIFVDSHDTIWIGTSDHGFFRLVRDHSGGHPTFEPIPHHSNKTNPPLPINVTAIGEDPQGVIWVGSQEGLYAYAPDRDLLQRYVNSPNDSSSLGNNYVRQIYRDRADALWIGTDGGGLNRMLPNREPDGSPRFQRYMHDTKESRSLASNAIESLFEDRSGVLWVSTYQTGLNKLVLNPGRDKDRERPALFQYRTNAADPLSLSGDMINAMGEDRFGNLWIGTDGFGLNRVIPPAHASAPLRFEHFRADPKKAGELQEDVITSMFRDSKGQLWLGTFTKGLVRMDQTTATGAPRFTHFRHKAEDPSSLGGDFVWAIFEDHVHRYWIGLDGSGLDLFDPRTGKAKHFRAAEVQGKLSSDTIYALAEDSYGTLWIGTVDGLNRLNPETGEFRAYRPGAPGSIGDGNINALHIDSTGVLWVGTNAGGLNKAIIPPWQVGDLHFTQYGPKDGLPSDVVNGILEDAGGLLWLSGNNALCSFDPKTGKGRPFIWQEALREPEFIRSSVFRSACGDLFFGGNAGFSVFHPDDIVYNVHVPSVAITDFQLFNRSVSMQERLRGKGKDAELTLSAKDTIFAFEFAALHFTAPDKNEYAYMLEGLDKHWNRVGNRHFVSYNTLAPGHYVFRVKGSNCDGVWGKDEYRLKIDVLPPWWKTWWFRFIAASSALCLATLAYLARIQSMRRRNRILQNLVAERTRALAEAMEALKNQSLTDPLTGLRNRRFLEVCMPEDISQIQRVQRQVTADDVQRMKLNIDALFIMADLDFFKHVNDQYGHHAGDLVLQQVSEIFRACVRTSDTVVRWGGEEFLIVARNTARSDASILPERIRAAVEAHEFNLGERTIRCTCSIGFSVFPFAPGRTNLLDWEQTVGLADQCLYVAKRNGRNAWVGIIPCTGDLATIDPQEFSRRIKDQGIADLVPVITSIEKPLQWKFD